MTTNARRIYESFGSYSFILTFLIMYVFWLLNSGQVEFFYLSLGLISAFVVAYLFHDGFIQANDGRIALLSSFRFFVYYAPWLFWQIALSNWDVVKRVLSPEMPIDPLIVKFQSGLKSPIAITTFANSITLTPGTITVDVDAYGTFYVHSIAPEPAESLLHPMPCEMAARVGHVFGENGKWK